MNLLQSLPQQLSHQQQLHHQHQHVMAYQALVGPVVVVLISAVLEEEIAIMIMNAQETLFVVQTIV